MVRAQGFTVSDLQVDAVEGGDYRLAIQPPEGDAFHIRGTFRSIEAPLHLAFTFVYEEPDPDDQETLVSVIFEPAEQVTRIVLEQGRSRPRRAGRFIATVGQTASSGSSAPWPEARDGRS